MTSDPDGRVRCPTGREVLLDTSSGVTSLRYLALAGGGPRPGRVTMPDLSVRSALHPRPQLAGDEVALEHDEQAPPPGAASTTAPARIAPNGLAAVAATLLM